MPESRIYASDRLLMSYRVHPTQSIAAHTHEDNGDSDILFDKLPELWTHLSTLQKGWLIDNMCNFLRRFATWRIVDPSLKASEVAAVRRTVANQLERWRTSNNPFAQYVRLAPTHWRQWIIWNCCRTAVGVYLTRLVLDVSGRMGNAGPRPPAKAISRSESR